MSHAAVTIRLARKSGRNHERKSPVSPLLLACPGMLESRHRSSVARPFTPGPVWNRRLRHKDP